MKDFNINTKNNDEWLTPPYIIKALGEFDLDPCSPIKRPWDTAKHHFSIKDNGLIKPWRGRIWLNPPYGRETPKWLDKLSKHGNGIALIFARTDTNMFFNSIWPQAHAIYFLKNRIPFYSVKGLKLLPAMAPSCLIAYGKKNALALKQCSFKGFFINL